MRSSRGINPKLGGYNRRQFFARSAAAGAGIFQGLAMRAALPGQATGEGPGYGPLIPAGNELALPPGFKYSIVSTEGDMMDDGFPVPKAMDGMAAFPLPNGNVMLIRNHEDNEAPDRLRPRPAGSTSTSAGIFNGVLNSEFGPRAFAYDQYAGGGTTSVELAPDSRWRIVRQFWSLVGTLRPCAGGPTPWGSWLSCEETTESRSATGFDQNHGYVFEVPVSATPGNPAPPVPLKRLGRFPHEAAAVDPATGIIYETEDNGDVSGLYRFVPSRRPTRPGDLAELGGTLEMLRVDTSSGFETAIGQRPGFPLPVSWVPVGDPDPTPPNVTVSGVTMASVFKQGLDGGGARFRRLEGCWFNAGKLYFLSTNGGNMGLGQVFVYDPAQETLTLIFESSGVDILDGPDNMIVSPRGGIVLCEDAGSAQFLRGISPRGEIFDFARNLHNSIEFAGTCFSPDGQTLFVNIYGRSTIRTTQPYRSSLLIRLGAERNELALTLAIWGPWGTGLL
jgi:uncharacterized protein